jgi:UDP-N-acetylmuramoyl-L-alanyl-D-glutamate--2,6-diaminopimelate ligase
MIRDILTSTGKKIGMIGSLYDTYANVVLPVPDVYKESLDLHRLLKDMVDAGMEYVVLEVSSHALVQNKVYGLRFEISLFTNMSQEHLDFHKT